MKVASISELKDNLSAHLDLARSGERIVVTDRKSPIATLERIPPGSLSDSQQRMVAAGIIAPREQSLDPALLLAMPMAECSSSLVAAVLEERAETR
jgi:antitoxin (DNA-binding transcriptional repressor) of toxin-antitoxin stability system